MDPAEHGRRLVDVLLLPDAVPSRPKGEFNAPRMCSVCEPVIDDVDVEEPVKRTTEG